jgi:serine/threonine protein phosphatase PrpC
MQTNTYLSNGQATVYHDNSYHGEDTFVTRELTRDIALDAVLDGATGRGGSDASAHGAEVLRTANVQTVEELTTLLEVANKQLFQRGKGRFFLTTASVALKIHRELHVLNVGDSPVYLIRDSDLMPLTPTVKGHTFLGLANALGRQERLFYKTTCVSLQAGDRLVLATDGLSENVAPSELAEIVARASSPEAAVAALRQLLCQKKRDNKGRIDEHSGFRRDDATAVIRYIGLGIGQETSGSAENSRMA